MAVTDHDSTEGIPEAQAAGRGLGVEVIAGVEINTDVPGSEVHVLGYFVDPSHADSTHNWHAYARAGSAGRARWPRC